LVEALFKSGTPLKELNLSHNNIGDKGAVALSDVLGTHYHLKILNISWNKIKTIGGIAIAEALKLNSKIVFFDGSFNSFGFKKNGDFGTRMAEACNNKVLKHVDLSYNSLDARECELFAEIIHDNHSLWGLHMTGNDCVVDSMNFVKAGLKTMK
jgi:hypothetical protein